MLPVAPIIINTPIHGLSRATYMAWKRQARQGYLNSCHGNQSMKRLHSHIVQVEGTIMAIVHQNANLMPNEMKGIRGKHQDIQKVLPAPSNSKHILKESNRVNCPKLQNHLYSITIQNASPYFMDGPSIYE